MEDWGRGLDGCFRFVLLLIPLAVLGVWKLIDIVVWVCHHLHWS